MDISKMEKKTFWSQNRHIRGGLRKGKSFWYFFNNFWYIWMFLLAFLKVLDLLAINCFWDLLVFTKVKFHLHNMPFGILIWILEDIFFLLTFGIIYRAYDWKFWEAYLGILRKGKSKFHQHACCFCNSNRHILRGG